MYSLQHARSRCAVAPSDGAAARLLRSRRPCHHKQSLKVDPSITSNGRLPVKLLAREGHVARGALQRGGRIAVTHPWCVAMQGAVVPLPKLYAKIRKNAAEKPRNVRKKGQKKRERSETQQKAAKTRLIQTTDQEDISGLHRSDNRLLEDLRTVLENLLWQDEVRMR